MDKKKIKNTGRHWTGKTGSLHPVAKQVIQKDKKGKQLQVWQSIEAAANFFKLDKSNVAKCCQGKRKTAGGFKWAYKYPTLQRCYQYDNDWLLVKQHNTIVSASKKTGIKEKDILKCCEGRIEKAGGFYWRFIKKRY